MKNFLSIILLTLCFLIVFAPLAHAYDPDDPSTYYIANKTSGKFHLPNCSYLPNEYNSYLVDVHNTSKLNSLSPCGHCDPLNNEIKVPTEEPRPQQHNDTSSNYMIILPLLFFGVLIIAIIPLIRRKELKCQNPSSSPAPMADFAKPSQTPKQKSASISTAQPSAK